MKFFALFAAGMLILTADAVDLKTKTERIYKEKHIMKLGIIGGSGFSSFENFVIERSENVKTPFGEPSAPFLIGKFKGVETVFLNRHGKGHHIAPNELNHRANIYAMKVLGVTHILSLSAVGSLKEELAPRDVVIVDQYFDRTKSGANSFFGEGIVAHISMAEPVCPELSKLAFQAAEKAAQKVSADKRPRIHMGGTYVNMEGPAFSTKGESRIYKSWGLDVIGMTNMFEARLAREAGICYTTAAMVTDYDSWRAGFEPVTVDMILANLKANAALAKDMIEFFAEGFKNLKHECACAHALDCAIITSKSEIPEKKRKELAPIIGNRLD